MVGKSAPAGSYTYGMPPSNQLRPSEALREGGTPFDPTDHLLPPAQKSSAGPVVGIIIIVVLLSIGAFYFWGAHLNAQNPENDLPLILGDPTTAQ